MRRFYYPHKVSSVQWIDRPSTEQDDASYGYPLSVAAVPGGVMVDDDHIATDC